MNKKQLKDEDMDTIVGGSSYISQLQHYLTISSSRMPCFSVLYHKEGTPSTTMTHLNCAATPMGFNSLIDLAESSGKVTLISTNGKRQDFTADELKAMR